MPHSLNLARCQMSPLAARTSGFEMPMTVLCTILLKINGLPLATSLLRSSKTVLFAAAQRRILRGCGKTRSASPRNEIWALLLRAPSGQAAASFLWYRKFRRTGPSTVFNSEYSKPPFRIYRGRQSGSRTKPLCLVAAFLDEASFFGGSALIAAKGRLFKIDKARITMPYLQNSIPASSYGLAKPNTSIRSMVVTGIIVFDSVLYGNSIWRSHDDY